MLFRWNPWRGLGGLPRGVWILFAATLVNRMGTMALPFLVLYLTKSLSFTANQAGLALTAYGAAAFVTGPIAGRLCDRVGPARILKGSLLASGVVLLLFPLARTWELVLVATVLLAFSAEGFRPASLAALTHLVGPEDRKAAFAASRLATNLGMSVGPAVGGLLATISYPSIFWADGATSILAWIVLVRWPIVLPGEEKGAADTAAPGERPAGIARALKDPRLLLFLAASVLCAVIIFQLEGAMPLYLVRDLGFPESVFGFLLTINTVLIVFLEVRLNLATAHWRHSIVLPLGALLQGLGFGALAFAHDVGSVALTVVVWTFGEMILLPAMSSHVAAMAPPTSRGTYMGLYTMAWSIAFSVGPWLGTVTLDRFGGRTLWLGVFACSLAAAAAMSLCNRYNTNRPA